MRNILVLFVVYECLVPLNSAAILVEDFDDDNEIVKSTEFFSDGGQDYLGITGSNPDFGLDTLDPPSLPGYTGFANNFLVGEDLNGEGAVLPVTLTWMGINITSLTTLSLSGDFAAPTGGIDSTDFADIAVDIDGGGFTTVLSFRMDETALTNSNNDFQVDRDFDGVGDDETLGLASQQISAAISGVGSSMDLRISLWLNAGGEAIAIDNLQVTGAAVPEASAFLFGAIVCGVFGAGYTFKRMRNAKLTRLPRNSTEPPRTTTADC